MKKTTLLTAGFLVLCSLAGVRADLVAFYSFDDPVDPLNDDSGMANHLTSVGADPTYEAVGGYDGSGGYLFANTVGDQRGDQRLIAPIDINPGTLPTVTLGAFVRTDTLNADLYKIMGHDNGAWDRTIGLDSREGGFRYTAFTGTNNNGPVDLTPAPANTTDWTFIAVTYDNPNATVTVYVDLDTATSDDPLVSVSEATAMGAGLGTVSIGSLRPDNNAEGWVGSLDNVFIFDEILDPARLSEIRRRGALEILGIPEGDPAIRVQPLSLFGDLSFLGAGPAPITRPVVVTNIGATQNLNINGVAVNGVDRARYDVVFPIDTVLAPGEQTEIEIVFTPPTEGGSFEATLDLISNDENRPSVEVTLNATTTSDPNLEASPNDPLFGRITVHNIPNTVMRKVVLTNTGIVNDLALSPLPTVSGADAASYSVSGPIRIGPGATRELMVTLNTGGSAGPFAARLAISTDDPDHPGFNISLDAELVTVPPATLLGFWCFDDENDPFADSSGNGNHITEALGPGGPAYGSNTGFEGSGAYAFSGDGDRLIAPIDVNPAALPQMSWGAWVRTNSLAPGLRKVMGHDNGAWDRTIGLDTRDQSFRYTSFTGFQRPVEGSVAPVSTTDWTFLAATYDQDAQSVTVFVDLDVATTDDQLVAETEVGNFNSGWPTFAIGAIRPDLDNEGWDGAIDNAFVYEGILTTAQLHRLRTRGKEEVLGKQDGPRLQVERAGGDLVFTWESAGGKLYNLRSRVDPSVDDPVDWPIFGGNAEIVASPPLNTLSIPMPGDDERFFVIEEFNAPPVELLNEDFESGPNGWTWGSDLDPGTDWQLGPPTNGPSAAHSGANCYGTNLDADYASDANIWLRSPEIDLTDAGGATLKFWHYFDTEQGIDLCTLSVVDSVSGASIAVLDTYDFFSNDWEEVTKVLPAAALDSKVKIEFRLTTDDAVFWPGWFVDDVVVTVP